MTDVSTPSRRPRGRNRPVVKFPLKFAHEYLPDGTDTTPTFPIDATEGTTELGMQGNAQWGDCVDAGGVHLEMVTSVAAGQSPPFNPQPNDGDGCLGVQRYKEQTGATEPPGPGTDMASYMEWGRKKGLWKAWAPLDVTKKSVMQWFMQQGYGVLIGVDLTDDNETEFNNGQPFNAGPGEQPDPEDGHCVLWAYSETATGPHKVGTWGVWWDTTDVWIEDCLVDNSASGSEAYLVVTNEEQLAAFTPALLEDVTALGGQGGTPVEPTPPTPTPTPEPTPTPQPTPGPTPPPLPDGPGGLRAFEKAALKWIVEIIESFED